MWAVLEQNPFSLKEFHDLLADRDLVIRVVARHGFKLQWLTEEMSQDRGVVLAAVARRGYALAWASPELQKDRDIALLAVARHGYAIQWVAPELRTDEIWLTAMTQRPMLSKAAARRWGFHTPY